MTNDKNKSVADELEEALAGAEWLQQHNYPVTAKYWYEVAAELRGKYQLLGW